MSDQFTRLVRGNLIGFVALVSWCVSSAVDANTGSLQPVTLESAVSDASIQSLGARNAAFSWRPGTTQLLLHSPRPTGGSEIRLYDVVSGEEKVIAAGSNPLSSPNGRFVAFQKPSEDKDKFVTELWIADLQSKTVPRLLRRVEAPPASGSFVEFAWSPDSARILEGVFSSGVKGITENDVFVLPEPESAQSLFRSYYRAQLAVTDIESGAVAKILDVPEQQRAIGWLDRDRIFFEQTYGRSLEGNAGLFVLDLKTGERSTVFNEYGRQASFSSRLSPDGRAWAFRADPGQEVYFPRRADLAVVTRAGNVKLLTRNEPVGSRFDWTPDSRRIIFTSGSSTARHLFLIDLNGRRVQLTSGDGVNESPRVGPGGRLAWLYTSPQGVMVLKTGVIRGNRLVGVVDLRTISDPLSGFSVGRAEVIRWRAPDGLQVDGLLVVPQAPRPPRGYPLVVVLHGGPEGGIMMADMEWPGGPQFVHLLAARGYAVFSPDYRESGMLGFDHLVAAREAMETHQRNMGDINSGVDELTQRGIADPKRLFLIGHSAGAVVASWAATDARKYRSIVAFEGHDSFFEWTCLVCVRPNLSAEWTNRGSPISNPAAYQRSSAVLRASQISTPTMYVASGSLADTSPSTAWLFAATQARGLLARYVRYPDDNHVIVKEKNKRDFLIRLFDWFEVTDLAQNSDRSGSLSKRSN